MTILALPVVLALIGLGGLFLTLGNSKDDTDFEVGDADRTLPTAKGRLTKALNKLSLTMTSVEALRAEIAASPEVARVIDYVNEVVERDRESILKDAIQLEHFTAACATLDHASFGLNFGFEKLTDTSLESCAGWAGKSAYGVSLTMPLKATEPAFPLIKTSLSNGLDTLHDYEKARQKINKVIRCLEEQIESINQALKGLSLFAKPDGFYQALAMPLIEDLMKVLIFYAKPTFTRKGNIKKIYK